MSKKGFLGVSKEHQLYYETHGNQDGLPILVLHGGPGGHTSERDLQFFDLNKHYVILFDQRGCGKSLPKGALFNNETKFLIEDCKTLLDFLQVESAVLFGGSWGSTLALLLTLSYPNLVKGLILRGVFLASKKARAFFEEGGSEKVFPKYWKRLESLVPNLAENNVLEYYNEQILRGDLHSQKIYSYEWERYGLCLSRDKISEQEVKDKMIGFADIEKVQLLMHYGEHNFFIPDNYILKHIKQIPNIPIDIVHGKNDWICHSTFADELHKALPESKLHLVDAGHSAFEKNTLNKLKEISSNWSLK